MRWVIQHIRALVRTIKELLAKPSSSLISILSIGIALTLPLAGYGLIKSTENLSFAFEHKPHINVYISPDAKQFDIDAISAELNFTDGIAEKKIISKAQALASFEKESGITNVLTHLNKNPLPTTIVITPTEDFLSTNKLEGLKETLEKIDGIDSIQINHEWLERIGMITSFSRMIFLGIALLVSVAIIFTLSNTIRLLIASKKNEILVGKLVGATNRFVRLPFLYIGFIYGALGGLCAYGLYTLCRAFLQEPVTALANSYQTSFDLYTLNIYEICILIFVSGTLGLLAARLSVATHLYKIKPR